MHCIERLNTENDTKAKSQNVQFHGIAFPPNVVRVMVFNGTFNNISAISWQSVLLVEKTRVPGENY
jgi:hypothetical protein